MPRCVTKPNERALLAVLFLLPLLAGILIASAKANQQTVANNNRPYVIQAAELSIDGCPIELRGNPDTALLLRYLEACQPDHFLKKFPKRFGATPIHWVRPSALTNRCLDDPNTSEEDPIAPTIGNWTPHFLHSAKCAPSASIIDQNSDANGLRPKMPDFARAPMSDLNALQQDLTRKFFESELKILTIDEQIAERRMRNRDRLPIPEDFGPYRPFGFHDPCESCCCGCGSLWHPIGADHRTCGNFG